jgi:uncharacterized protein YjiS (DUF1127 family)
MKTIIDKYTSWKRYRKTKTELSSMSDRDLNDIGIKRWDIERIAKESAALQAS